MSLFRNRALKWVPFRRGAVAEAERPPLDPTSTEVWDGPSLVMLVSDASGRASFQFHSFPDAAAATDYVQVWYPSQMDGGVVAFWALTEEPARNENNEPMAEAVVLIRDEDKTGVVYLFSFVDMEDARIFVKSETENGCNAECVMVYWAAPVRIDVDDAGSVRLNPEFPPSDLRIQQRPTLQPVIEKLVDAPATNGWARVIGRNVQISPAVDESTNGGVARIAAAASEVVRAEAKAKPMVKAPRVEASSPQTAPVEKIEAAPVEASTVEAKTSEAAPAKKVAEPQTEATPVETAEIEAAAVKTAPAAPATNGVKPGAKQAQSTNGTNGSKPHQLVKVEARPGPEAPRASMEDAKPQTWFEVKDGTPPRDGETWRNDGFHDIAFDIDKEVNKVLQVKRWEAHDKPFEGFESPPGRF